MQYRAKILIVDDSTTNLMLLGEILTPEYDVLVATSGEIALQVARNLEPPDLILINVKITGCNKVNSEALR